MVMGNFISLLCQFTSYVCKRGVLAVGLVFCLVYGVSAQEVTVSEHTFGCILDWPKVRNTRIKHDDPEKLKEAKRILRDSVPETEYPVGTILQLVPHEAMVKHSHDKFPKTNGWEFFFLEVNYSKPLIPGLKPAA